MNLFEAKRVLKNKGFRVIKEAADVYSDIREILMDDGYDGDHVEDLMQKYEAEIEDLLYVNRSAFEIAAAIEGYEEDAIADDETEEIELGGDRFEDYIDPDEYMGESKSYKGKSDKFDRKAKLAGKKKCKHCEDCDDEDLDESMEQLDERLFCEPAQPGREGVLLKIGGEWFPLLAQRKKPTLKFNALEYIVQNGGKDIPLSEIRQVCFKNYVQNCSYAIASWKTDGFVTVHQEGIRKYVSITPKGMKLYKATADYLAGKPVKGLVSREEYEKLFKKYGWDKYYERQNMNKNESVHESLEDLGVVRGPRGQQGTEDWSDFKDEFRTKTAILKTALTSNFVSGLIKDFDFEIDNKDIREVAFDNVDAVYGTKNAVKNLQARVREYFKKMFKK